jgi:hypothetical protein
MDIETLYIRMKKVGGNLESGISFSGEKVKLWWEISKEEKQEVNLYRHQLTVTSRDFQNAMKKAEIEMNNKMRELLK